MEKDFHMSSVTRSSFTPMIFCVYCFSLLSDPLALIDTFTHLSIYCFFFFFLLKHSLIVTLHAHVCTDPGCSFSRAMGHAGLSVSLFIRGVLTATQLSLVYQSYWLQVMCWIKSIWPLSGLKYIIVREKNLRRPVDHSLSLSFSKYTHTLTQTRHTWDNLL